MCKCKCISIERKQRASTSQYSLNIRSLAYAYLLAYGAAISEMSKRGFRPLPMPSSTVNDLTTNVNVAGNRKGCVSKRGKCQAEQVHTPPCM